MDIMGTDGRAQVFGHLHKRKTPVLELARAHRRVSKCSRKLDMGVEHM